MSSQVMSEEAATKRRKRKKEVESVLQSVLILFSILIDLQDEIQSKDTKPEKAKKKQVEAGQFYSMPHAVKSPLFN